MKQLKSTRIIKPHIQQDLFPASSDPPGQPIHLRLPGIPGQRRIRILWECPPGEFPGGPGPDPEPHPDQRTAR